MALRRTHLGLAAAFLAGCTLLVDPFELPRSVALALDGSSIGPEAASEASIPIPCVLDRPPSRPNVQDGPSQPSTSFAARRLRVRATDGFDLDNRCTCDDAGTEAMVSSSCFPKNPKLALCDGPGGRDNAAAAFLAQGRAGDDYGFDEIARRGDQTILFELRDYNGSRNDPSVVFSVVDSPGLDSARACEGDAGPDTSGDAGKLEPTWSGCDTWARVASPPLEASNAWVREGVIVAAFDNLPLRLADIYIRLRGAVLTATPSNVAGEWVVRLGGSVAPRELVESLGQAIFQGQPLCRQPQTYGAFARFVCDGVDMTQGVGSDCNALSFGAELDTVRVSFGQKRPPLEVTDVCDGGSAPIQCD